MTARRLLMATGTGGIAPTVYVGLYNGQDGSSPTRVEFGTFTSVGGASFTRHASNPVMSYGTSGAWDDEQLHGPSLLHDGTQYIVYYGGYDGTKYQIGRATSSDRVTWTKYASNPVLTPGTAGAFDDAGMNFPTVVREDASTWHMWYTGWKSGGKTTIGYASSSDGISWSKQGKVLDAGSAGQFDDEGLATGPVLKVGSTWYVYYAGQAETSGGSDYNTGYATCTTPATAGTYTKQGVIAAFTGELTIGGTTYQSNQLRSLLPRGSEYIGWGSAFQPVDGSFEEVSFVTTTTDLATFTTPNACMPLTAGWDSISAENPSVILSPAV